MKSTRSKEELKDKSWLDILVERIEGEKKAPYIITGGLTPSGPTHIGTVCEILYPSLITSGLGERGHKAAFNFVSDIMDAFDGVPFELKAYEKELAKDLGKPLMNVLDPLRCHESYGEHYLAEMLGVARMLGLNFDVTRSSELYSSGKMDSYAKLFLKEEARTKEVVARSSLRPIERMADWSPIMPICAQCGKIATTRVTKHGEDEYEYACDKDVRYTKGCGHKGRAKISDHKYKLTWRLHWPTWQAVFQSSAEGAGVDHFTRGGSVDTAVAVHKEILGREPPIGYKWGFILFDGKKLSKSQGIGATARDLLKIEPPEVIKYLLAKPDLEQNKDMLTRGDSLMLVYGELEKLGASQIENLEKRNDVKNFLAFRSAVKKLGWSAPFVDVLLYYQIYREWDRVAQVVGDEQGVGYLAPYIEEWVRQRLEPERYNFTIQKTKITELNDHVAGFAARLEDGMKDIDVHNLIYDFAKSKGIGSEELFKAIYRALIGKDSGPKLGKFIYAIGIAKVREMLQYAAS
ncbi:MAG: lysine--tRNA ligase [Candidatus Micrarchaeota archaeon]|nr:lysine--tRNA ligase [Candidatus Micrarchaeota archaeon]